MIQLVKDNYNCQALPTTGTTTVRELPAHRLHTAKIVLPSLQPDTHVCKRKDCYESKALFIHNALFNTNSPFRGKMVFSQKGESHRLPFGRI